MPISYIFSGEPMTGTANDDFFIAFQGSTGTSNNTVNGNNGDDLVIGDSSDSWLLRASTLNGSIATAHNLESVTGIWTTAENEMFGDWTIPHSTTIVEATIGQSEFFRVAIGAGQQITIDLDFASNTAIGDTRDLVVELLDSLGNVLVTADDSLITQGGRGSFPSAPGSASSYDPYLTFTAPSAGIYYINVRPYGDGAGGTFTENNTFVLNVSVTGHAVAANNPVQGADTINGGDGDDALFGQGGGDVINGDGGDDQIDSGSGGDIVHGGEGNDTLYGGDGTEENIHGDNGNDTLISGGEGHYYGDAGNDIIYAGLTSGVNEVLDGGADIDTIDTTSWSGSYTINMVTGVTVYGESFINFENIVTGNGADTVTGTDGANVITTNGGIDTVNAGAGKDIVAGGADGDTLDGGANFDILSYRTSSGAVTINLATNTVIGGHAAGDLISNFEGVWGSVLGDTLTANVGNNDLRGYEGNDILSGGAGADTLDGGINDDSLAGGAGDDTLDGGAGIDTADYASAGAGVNVRLDRTAAQDTVGAGIDTLANLEQITGSAFADRLIGDALANRLDGGAGDDVLNGLAGDDTLAGGVDNDTYFVDAAGDAVIEKAGEGIDQVRASLDYTLGTEVEILTLGGAAREGTGNTLDNTIFGAGGADTLYGLGGDDILRGKNARDELRGGGGDDLLDGGQGKDTMIGAAGQDMFQFRDGDFGGTRAVADVITDFDQAAGEKIQLNLVDANTNAGGNQAFVWIGNGAFTGVAGQLHYVHQGGNTYVEGDLDGDSVADIFINLTGTMIVDAADFVL